MTLLSILLAFMLQSGLFTVEIHQNIPYSRTRGYWCESKMRDNNFVAQAFQFPKAWWKRDLTLKLDLYRPHEADAPRPLVMLMHGGAFFANSKSSMPCSRLCHDLAENGFVAVSIDYRMGFNLHKRSVERAATCALNDAGNALHFLLANADAYGIDTTRVFIGGASSGAITTLKLAARENNPNILGVIDMWGAVERIDLLDSTDVALIAFHGDRDNTVPFTEGWPLGGKCLMNYLYGSIPLVGHLQALGKDARLVVIKGYGHAPYRDKDYTVNSNYDTIRNEILSFLGNFISLRP